MIRYSRGTRKHDAYPALKAADDFDAFERAVLNDRARRKGLQYIAAPFKANGNGKPHRCKADVEPRRFLPLDVDKMRDAETYHALRMRLAAYRGFGYTTASHKPDAPRCRVILELDREVDRIEGMRIGAAVERSIKEEFGDAVGLDSSVYRGEQPCYGPVIESEAFRLTGDSLNVEQWLESAPPIEPERTGSAAIDPDDDPVVIGLKERALYLRNLGAGQHAIRCPWQGEHTSEDDNQSTATCYFQPHHAGYVTPGFRCLHEHCKRRTGDDLLKALEIDWRKVKAAYHGAATPTAPPAPDPDWPRVQDIFRDVVSRPYAPQDFPEPVARVAAAFSASTGFDAGAALLACTAAAAAIIDDRYRLAVRPGSAWFESARLWVVLIGGPSAGKSPTIRVACDPIRAMHIETWQEWERANRDSKPEDRDPEPCYFTSDATLEALSDVLRANPRGVLMLTEEFASWIGSIDCYRNGQGSRDRGEMLQLFDGGPHQIHRVKRGSFLVPNWGASVLAAGTPAGLRENVRHLPDDGLIHRFLPCIMRRPGAANSTTVREALQAWDKTLRRLRAETTTPETLQRAAFSRPAWELFNAETARIREQTADAETIAPALASHLGKHPGLLARVALTFAGPREERGEISAETVEMAVRMLRTARKHAAALYLDILQTAPVCELARAVGRSIAAATDAPAQVSRAWLSSHCRAFRDAGDRNRRAAVEWLEDAGWLRPTQDSRPYGGWGATAWDVSPDVAANFGAVGDEHRQRRASVRSLIVGE